MKKYNNTHYFVIYLNKNLFYHLCLELNLKLYVCAKLLTIKQHKMSTRGLILISGMLAFTFGVHSIIAWNTMFNQALYIIHAVLFIYFNGWLIHRIIMNHLPSYLIEKFSL